MNTIIAATKRPRLHWPKALLPSRPEAHPGAHDTNLSPTLSAIELRRIVAEMTG